MCTLHRACGQLSTPLSDGCTRQAFQLKALLKPQVYRISEGSGDLLCSPRPYNHQPCAQWDRRVLYSCWWSTLQTSGDGKALGAWGRCTGTMHGDSALGQCTGTVHGDDAQVQCMGTMHRCALPHLQPGHNSGAIPVCKGQSFPPSLFQEFMPGGNRSRKMIYRGLVGKGTALEGE